MEKDRNPLRARNRGFRWVRDAGTGWEGAGVCASGVEQGGQQFELSRSGGVGNDRKSFRARKRRGLVKWASGIRTVGRVTGVVLVGWLSKPVLGGSALVRWAVGWIGAG